MEEELTSKERSTKAKMPTSKNQREESIYLSNPTNQNGMCSHQGEDNYRHQGSYLHPPPPVNVWAKISLKSTPPPPSAIQILHKSHTWPFFENHRE